MSLSSFSPWRRQTILRQAAIRLSQWTLPSAGWTAGFYRSSSTARKLWTAQDLDRLKTLWRDGSPVVEIACALARTNHAVNQKAWQLRRCGLLKSRPVFTFSPEENAILAEGRENGVSYKRLAMKLPGRTVRQLRDRRANQLFEARVFHSDLLTAAEVKTLVELRERQQLGWTAIAQLMSGRSPRWLSRFYRNRICPISKTILPSKDRLPAADVDRLKSLRAQGWTIMRIALETGRAYDTVYRLLQEPAAHQMSLIRTTIHWTSDDVDELQALRSQGFTHRQIGEKLKRSTKAVANKLANLRDFGHQKPRSCHSTS